MNGTDRSIDEEDAIDLAPYLDAFQRRWKLTLLGAMLGGAVGLGLAAQRPLRYEGVTTLLVVPPSQPSGAQINPATFRAIVENATLASQVISELKLDGLSAQGFVESALAVEELRGTNIVKVKVTLPDPKNAAEASHRLAMKAVQLTQQVSQQEGASTQEQLKNHLNDAHDRAQRSEKELLTYKQSAQVELLKEDTDAMLRERGDLLRLVVDIEAERARLGAAQEEINRQQPVLSVARTPAAEDALRRSTEDPRQQSADDARRRAAEDARTQPQPARQAPLPSPMPKVEADAEHLDLSNPFVNPVYQTLDFQIATSRARIAALGKQRDELMNVQKLGGKDLAQLSELYRRQIELARLQANFDLATKVYGDLVVRYEQSRTQPVGSSAQLQVIDDALPPDRPVSRRRLPYAILGGGAGLLGAVLIALLWESRGRRIASPAA